MVGWLGDALKVKVQAPALDGRANAALTDFLADQLGLPRRAVVLVRGDKSRPLLPPTEVFLPLNTFNGGFLVASRWLDDRNWPLVRAAYFGDAPAPVRLPSPWPPPLTASPTRPTARPAWPARPRSAAT